MLDSPAYRVLSQAAHRILARIEVELGRHGGKDNGKLPVTTDDFVEYGIHRHAVGPAIRELEELGFIEVIRGHVGKAGQRRPSLYRLTYLHSFGEDPTNEWATVLTVEAAEKIAKEARSRKPSRQCRKTPFLSAGKRQFPVPEITTDTVAETITVSVPESDIEDPNPQCRNPSLLSRYSIHLERESQLGQDDLAQGSEPGSKPSGGSH